MVSLPWAVKEVTSNERVHNSAQGTWEYLNQSYTLILDMFTGLMITRYLTVFNILTTLISMYGFIALIYHIKGRLGTLSQSNAEATKTANNFVQLHNTVQFGTETRNNSIDSNHTIQYEKYQSNMKIEIWLQLLEIYLNNHVHPSKWAEHTIMSLNHELVEQIGPLNQFTNNGEGYSKLKLALIDHRTVAKPNEAFALDKLLTRKQIEGENVEEFGKNLKILSKDLLKSDDKLKQLFCRGIKNEKAKRKIAFFINDPKNKEGTFDKVIEYARSQEKGWELADDYLLNSGSSSDQTMSDSPDTKIHFQPTNTDIAPGPDHSLNKNNQTLRDSDTKHQTSRKDSYCSKCNRNGHTTNECYSTKYNNSYPTHNNSTAPNKSSMKQNTNNTPEVMALHHIESQDKHQNKGIKPISGKIMLDRHLGTYLCDPGAAITVISLEMYNRINTESKPLTLRPYSGEQITSCNLKIKALGEVYIKKCNLSSQINLRHTKMVVMDNLVRYDCLMGRDMIARISSFSKQVEVLRIQVEENSIDLQQNVAGILSQSEEEQEGLMLQKPENKEIIIFPGFVGNQPIIIENTHSLEHSPINKEVTNEAEETHVRDSIKRRLEECAAEKVADIDIEANRHMEFEIKLISPNQRPIYCKSRPLPQSLKEAVKKAIFEQVDAGLIRPSTSEWASPLHIVIKPDGTIRITIDYRLLNNVIEFDPYPMPATAELYRGLAESNWFSKFDFYKAYNQIPVKLECIKYTAFICEWGIFECPSMPQGIKTAAAWFQRCIDRTFADLAKDNILRSFLDDMVLHTVTLEAHLEGALRLINTMKSGTLKVSLKKCELVKKEITFLGKVVSRGKIKNCPSRSACIREMPLPKSYKGVQSALGTFNYQREFIPMFAEIAQPLYDILELKNVPMSCRKKNGTANGKFIVTWDKNALESFEKLKHLTGEALELYQPDFNLPFHLYTDASDRAYGSYIYQIAEGKICVVGYFSKTYTKAQQNYPTNEKELLGIVKSIEHFSPFLFGRHFRVYNDHLPLTFLFTKIDVNKRLQRWIEKLHMYSFTIHYVPGPDNVIADHLSRLYDDEETVEIASSEDDYNDMIIASLEELEPSHQPIETDCKPIKIQETTACNLIASLSTSEQSDSYEAHREQQELDSDISWIKQLILSGGNDRPIISTFENTIRRVLYKEYDRLRLINGLVYREAEDKDGHARPKYVLPGQTIEKVLTALHTSVYGAHLGRKRTTQKTIERFYRPFLIESINTFVKTCDSCQKIKTLTPRTRAPMMYIVPDHTNQIIASDFAGPLNTTKKGNKYLQIITDLYGKYLVVVAHPNKETRSAAKALVNNWCCTFGIPEACLTDGGKEYQSELWDTLCELFDIERVKTSIFHPQGDGQSERAVQTTKKIIAAYVNECQDDWDEYLPQFTYAYNSGVHETTKCTPFEAMFGRTPKLPLDLLYPNMPITQAILEQTSVAGIEGIEDLEETVHRLKPEVTKTIDRLRKKLKTIGKVLQASKVIKMDRAKIAHDRNIKREKYEIGDQVLCSHPKIAKGQKRGIAPKYFGPFRIMGVNPNGCNYVIKSDTKNARSKQVHKNNLKVYHPRGVETPMPDSQVNPITDKRRYNKNPNNARWNRSNQSSNDSSSSSSSAPEMSDSPVETTEAVVTVPKKRKYTKKATNQTKEKTTRSGRISKPPKTF